MDMARFDISQYSTVAERIDKFWAKYPNGRLHTELVHFSPEQVVMRGEVYLDREDTRPVTSDYAEERIDSSPVNRVSMVENCATSVLGRMSEAEKLSDVDALRLLWAEASQAGASPTVLEKVRERAEAVSSDGVLDGVAGGVPVRGKKPRS
jgi:hypothetical protein